jgi:hypothetical protein
MKVSPASIEAARAPAYIDNLNWFRQRVPMRADIAALADDIRTSTALLRRRL